MKMKKLARKLLSALPSFLSHPLIREQLKVDTKLPEGLEIRVARTKEELVAAYQILHDSYVEMGYMNPQESGMRVIKYFALPTTTNLIASLNGKVIGTLSVIRRTRMGLPLEDICSIESYCGFESVAEVSSLAIARDFRMGNGAIFLPLLKYFYEYTRFYMGIDRIFIAVNPRQVDFYRGILLFDRMETQATAQNYSFANNHKAVILTADFRVLEKRMEKIYGGKSDAKNLYKYFCQFSSDTLKFPDRRYKKIMDPVLTESLFSFFFIEKSNVVQKLSVSEKQLLSKMYPASFQAMIWSASPLRTLDPRFPVDLLASHEMKVVDASRGGLKLRTERSLQGMDSLAVEVSPGKFAQLQVRKIWAQASSQEVGLQILSSDALWDQYISYLENDFISEKTLAAAGQRLKRQTA